MTTPASPSFAVLHDPERLPPALARPVVAVGNFDGVHRGHKHVLQEALAMAASLDRPAMALTFEPHPRRFFRPEQPLFRLTPPAVKASLMAAQGLAGLLELRFDQTLASHGAEEFITKLLCRRLGVSGVVVGADFHFGRGREGTPAFLESAGARHGFRVALVPPLMEDGAVISSSAVRQALAAGDITRANALLGHAWFVRGEVVHGRKEGRKLGYPTANMRLGDDCALAHGIYAVRVGLDGVSRPAVASFGRRPTFDNGAPLLETFLFDFEGDLYGREIEVTFVAHLRPELKFDSLPALITQMDEDSRQARLLLG